jgi:hypothetical protein
MEGGEKPQMDKYEEFTNDWNYDASCTLTSYLVSDLENFKRLIIVHRVYMKLHSAERI